VERSPSWEASISSLGHESSSTLQNTKVYCLYDKSSPHVLIMNQINPVITPIPLLQAMHFIIILTAILILSSHQRLIYYSD